MPWRKTEQGRGVWAAERQANHLREGSQERPREDDNIRARPRGAEEGSLTRFIFVGWSGGGKHGHQGSEVGRVHVSQAWQGGRPHL